MRPDPSLRTKLDQVLAENARLREENTRLQQILGVSTGSPSEPKPEQPVAITQRSSAEAKVALFRSIFRGREDVYARRWERPDGRSGYSPACENPYSGYGGKGRGSVPEDRVFLPLTNLVIHDHLAGKHTIGVYPLLVDETCWFLACDFDEENWTDDAAAFLRTCRDLGVPAYLERSRSGNGGHVWVFFDRPVEAAQARRLGCFVLTLTMERRYQVGLKSYDRFFPNQDTMPKGGFGNLIALPLQKAPRDRGNSVFVDDSMEPHVDQWAYLAGIERMKVDEVDRIVREAERTGLVTGVRMSLCDSDDEEDPWTLPPSRSRADKPIVGPFPEEVELVQNNLVYVPREGLPSQMINRLIRLAAFQNPEFYKTQAMRMSTWDKPRIIGCAELEFPHHIGLPRGCLAEAAQLLSDHGIEVNVRDERQPGQPIDAAFMGELTPEQKRAADALLAIDIGILSATTAFGKTVVAAHLIAERRVNTLVLVHRRQLMDQWKERLTSFLGLPPKAVGLIGGGKNKPTGLVDIAVIQSMQHNGIVRDLVADYGQVIVDECHHLSAFSFERVLKQVKARYVVGLTATPVRKDGHHPIIMMQCGPIRYRVNAKEQAAARPFHHQLIPRTTDFTLQDGLQEAGIQAIYAALASDARRNAMIEADVRTIIAAGRSPLVLTERTNHVEELAERLKDAADHVIVLRGGTGARKRKEIAAKLASIPEGETRVLIATGRYVGEGFDDARLDTLCLALPISWRGTLQQYAGRLHRLYENKQVVQVYDYIDAKVPVLRRMYEKRLKGYEAIGYQEQKTATAQGRFNF
ncbi:MAG TPA: DEAD/DEAH box helicase family protein [Symbiobacteriaceae bacterium]|nr:DEAD/DEAH box helicase family protein [Symbiobacteriaceae bacterium]